jgi:hypothetical protein
MMGSLFGREIGQVENDLFAWEQILNLNPQFHWIIELGTYQGGMSWYLYTQAMARNLRFATLDINEPLEYVPSFYQLDLMEDFPSYWLWPKNAPGILFCDNGNKPREVELYKDQIHSESCIVVHDWGTEFVEADIPEDYRVYANTNSTVFLMRNDYLNTKPSMRKQELTHA